MVRTARCVGIGSFLETGFKQVAAVVIFAPEKIGITRGTRGSGKQLLISSHLRQQ